MKPTLSKRLKAFFWQNMPVALLATGIVLPIAAIFASLLLATSMTVVGLPGAEVAGTGLLNALALLAFLHGSLWPIVILFALLWFARNAWRLRMVLARIVLWCLTANLFCKSPAIRSWDVLRQSPVTPILLTTQGCDYQQLTSVGNSTGAFTAGLTPQLE